MSGISQWARLMGDASEDGVRVVAWHVPVAQSDLVSCVWTLAQTLCELPAPAISVDGESGWQVWFALQEARPAPEVLSVLRAVIRRCLRESGSPPSEGDVSAWRFSCWPAGRGADGDDALLPVPRQIAPDRWSAFVAPDLVPVFAETPWLDCEPSAEGQAALMGRWQAISMQTWGGLSNLNEGATTARHVPITDPRVFLQSVMNDDRVDMALRIEAARVLLAQA
jgi:hypothetical protein